MFLGIGDGLWGVRISDLQDQTQPTNKYSLGMLKCMKLSLSHKDPVVYQGSITASFRCLHVWLSTWPVSCI